MPKYKAPPASISLVPGATAKAPPPILMFFVEAPAQPPIRHSFSMNNAARCTVDIPFVTPDQLHITQTPVRPPPARRAEEERFYESARMLEHPCESSFQGVMPEPTQRGVKP